ncbi:MAG: 50S ribosomal protein L24 [Thaumarchaeota archaeon]|nr:50S ribosomal protein L24 [Nitrososphaerota archaeon]
MKPTKVRNYQIYRATYTTRSKQLGSHLSKDLQKKYGKRSIRITLGDTVKVIRGEYRGVDGKVSKIEMTGSSIAIEGIKKEKSRGEKFDIFIPASNVVVTGLNLDDHWRKTKLQGKKPKTTPKEVKPEESKEEKSKQVPAKEDEVKKETKSAKKSEKPKESKPEKKAKTKPRKKEKEAKE